MSVLSGKIKQLLLIISRLQTVEYTTKKEFMMLLEEYDFNVAERTFDRKIEDLRNEFSLNISFTPLKGYKLETTEADGRKYLELLNTAHRSAFLLNTVKDAKALLEFIDFEKAENKEVNKRLIDVISAIKLKHPIEFQYKPFYSDTVSNRHIKPYVLKEYMGRWYVIGEKVKEKEIRTYSLDRMLTLSVISEPFKEDRSKEIFQNLENIIGINYSIGSVQRVVVRFSTFQSKYQKSLPIHWSQRVINETPEWVDFEFMLIPNYEFQQRILMLGKEVEILEPKWLRDTFKDRISEMMKKYQG